MLINKYKQLNNKPTDSRWGNQSFLRGLGLTATALFVGAFSLSACFADVGIAELADNYLRIN